MSQNEATVNEDYQIEDCLVRMDEVNWQMSVLEYEKKEITEKIKTFMGDRDTLIDGYGRISVTWKGGKPMKRFDLESFKKENPEAYSKYLKMQPQSRKFLVKR
jgi:predicted phage-related endonuclease